MARTTHIRLENTNAAPTTIAVIYGDGGVYIAPEPYHDAVQQIGGFEKVAGGYIAFVNLTGGDHPYCYVMAAWGRETFATQELAARAVAYAYAVGQALGAIAELCGEVLADMASAEAVDDAERTEIIARVEELEAAEQVEAEGDQVTTFHIAGNPLNTITLKYGDGHIALALGVSEHPHNRIGGYERVGGGCIAFVLLASGDHPYAYIIDRSGEREVFATRKKAAQAVAKAYACGQALEGFADLCRAALADQPAPQEEEEEEEEVCHYIHCFMSADRQGSEQDEVIEAWVRANATPEEIEKAKEAAAQEWLWDIIDFSWVDATAQEIEEAE